MKTLVKAFVCLLMLAGFVVQSQAALITEGTLQAVLDPSTQTPGFVLSNGIPNGGAMGGIWLPVPTNSQRLSNNIVYGPSVITEPGGLNVLDFDGAGTNGFSTWTAGQATGTNLPAPASLVGLYPHLSVEAWVMSPTVGGLSTIVSWGNSSTSSNQFLFNYGTSDGNIGGSLNFGSQTFNWGAGGPPAPGVYHYLVTTYDGVTNAVYCDGVLQNLTTNYYDPRPGTTNTVFAPQAGYAINIGSSRGSGASGIPANELGTITTTESDTAAHARMHIGKVRVMDGVLTPSDIANNYSVDVATFALTPSTLVAKPIHAWLFNNTAGDAQFNPTVQDIGSLHNKPATVYSVFSPGFPPGMATFKTTTLSQGTYLHMEGGSPTNGAYVDLGTNLITAQSAYATNNGLSVGAIGYNSAPGSGTGQITVEGWLTVQGHPNFWQTYFAFGATTGTNYYTTSTNTNTMVVTTNFITTNIISGHSFGQVMYGQTGPGAPSTSAAVDGQLAGNTSGFQGVNVWLFQVNNTGSTATKLETGNANSDNYYGGYSNAPVYLANGTYTNTSYGMDDNWYSYGDFRHLPFTMTQYACSWNEANNEILLYINGLQVSRKISHMKMFMVYDRNGWLGRDFYVANPTLEGDYYEFRMYSNILSPAEVLGDYEAGPGYTNNVALGSPTALHLVRTTSSSNWVGSAAYFTVTADYASANGVNVFANGVTYTDSDPTVIALTAGRMNFLKPGTATITASYGGKTATSIITVVPLAATMTHRLSFGADSIGAPYDSITSSYPPGSYGYNGATPTGQNYPHNGVLITNGANTGSPGWIDMGQNWISNPTYDALTVELWASFGSPNGTAPLFSFGDERQNAVGLVSNVNTSAPNQGLPSAGALAMRGRYAIEAYSSPNTQLIWSADDPEIGNSGSTGPVNYGVASSAGGRNLLLNQHIVAEYHPTGGFARVYVNGVPTTQTNTYLPLMDALVDNYNYIGVSVNSGYAALAPGAGINTPIVGGNQTGGGTENTNNMFLQEFRVYNGILPQSNVVIDLATGPNLIVQNPGNIVSVTLVTPASMFVNQTIQTSLSATFQNVTNVNMFLYDTNSTVFVEGLDFTKATGTNMTVTVLGSLTAVQANGTNNATNYLVASYPGFPAVTNAVIITPIIAVLKHDYSFTTNTGVTVTNVSTNYTWDSVAGALNATNFNGAFESGGQLILTSNTFDFLQLPAEVFDSNYAILSLEFWASFTNNGSTNAANCDLYGFGNVDSITGFGAYYVSFSPHSGTPNASSKINGTDPATAGAGEVAATTATGVTLDGRTNIHVVATFHPYGGFMQLYTNGVLVQQTTLPSTVPTPLFQVETAGSGTFGQPGEMLSYIGKPLYTGNAFINASVDEFRIYSGLLVQPQIMVDTAIGPNQFVNLGNTTNVGTITNVTLSINPTMYFDQTQTAVVLATWTNANLPGVPITLNAFNYQASINAINGKTTGYPTLTSANLNVVSIVNSNIVAVGLGSTTVTATFAGNTSAAATVTVIAPPGPVAITHDFHFNEAIGAPGPVDSITGLVGTNFGTAAFDGVGHLIVSNVIGGVGASNYVSLPTNVPMLKTLTNATIEAWVLTIDPSTVYWGRIFDFGEADTNVVANGLDYTYMTGNGNGEGIAFRTKPIGATYAFDPAGPQAGAAGFLTPTETYIAVTYDVTSGANNLYVDGTNVSSASAVSLLGQVNEVSDYLGRSHYSGDPGGNFTYDEFRISTNAKSGPEIVAQYAAGPNAIAGASLLITNSPATPGKLRLLWPIWASRYGAGSVYSSPALVGPTESWSPVGGVVAQVTNATHTANTAIIYNYEDITPSSTNVFYRLQ